VLAAIGFLVCRHGYSKRQNWAYAHFRGRCHQRPAVDDKDDTPPARQSMSSQLGENAIRDLFGGQGGAPSTQTGEVNRKLEQVKAGSIRPRT